MNDVGPWERAEGKDRWSKGHGLIGQKRGCSFCGSMHPDDFLDLVEQGYEVGPTDKDYKAYLTAPPTNEDRERHALAADRFPGLANQPVSGATVGKFYFQHLDTAEHRQRFIDLYNAGTMKIGYPGRFYVQPFFVRAATEEGG